MPRQVISKIFITWKQYVIEELDRQIKITLARRCQGSDEMDTKWKIINGVVVTIFIIAALYWIANS